MAQAGTISAVRNSQRDVVITIAGLTENNNSPPFLSLGYAIGSFVVSGTLGATNTIQLQGSNDGGTTWVNVLGTAISSLPGSGSMIGQNNEVFQLYQFVCTGGDGTTSINATVFLSATFG